MNRGLDSARGDLVVFTDDDAEAQADWLERIEAKFADPSVGAVGGRDWIQLPDEPALFRPAPVAKGRRSDLVWHSVWQSPLSGAGSYQASHVLERGEHGFPPEGSGFVSG